jgi:hypothetical protein
VNAAPLASSHFPRVYKNPRRPTIVLLAFSHPQLNLLRRYTLHRNLYTLEAVLPLHYLSMSFNDLPIELFEPIVSNIVEDLGIIQAAKYRLICSK